MTACSTVSEKAARVTVIDRETAKQSNCIFVDRVSITTDTMGKPFPEGLEYAKGLAREDAADMGATHIVWTDTERGYVATVKGEAYRCNGSQPK
jgi:hypothetical protein